ncbi:MAG TPA: ferrochelatase [Candidatus Limnocylindrales bacterium]|nr:ferrochelatase [Candidatus Limnocylindrales bacterium]
MTDAVLLMAYGSPDRLDQVEAYYTDIRRGSPPPPHLLAELVERYRAIGGGSPLSRIVERQRAALERELATRGRPRPVYAGMKHIAPFIRDVVGRMADDGVRHAVAIALAPQASAMSSSTYRRAVEVAAAELGDRAPAFAIIDSWHDQARFIEALAARTAEAIARTGVAQPFVLFTAHSLPARIVAAGDPYPGQLAETARLVSDRLGLARYGFAYQSAGRTDEAWLGPDLRDEIRRLAADGVRDVVVCAVGFVADHLEVLYDIDIEAAAVAREAGVRLERAPTMNDDPTFIAGLADLVEAATRESVAAR